MSIEYSKQMARTLLYLFGMFFPLQGAAQTDSAVEEVVVTSSRIPTPRRQIGTSVAVLTEADIAAHGNTSLSEVLRQLPAISTSSNGGAGKTVTMRIRGEDGFRTLTLFDGLRLSDPSSPQVGPQLEHILSSGIGRVEVLRGPQGLAYGADAGGVLNISSRQTAVAGVDLDIDAQKGSFDTRQYSGTLRGGTEGADFFMTLADLEVGGFNTRTVDDSLQDKDGYRNTTFHGRAGVDLAETWRLDAVHRRVDGRNEYDSCDISGTQHRCLALHDLHASRLALSYRGAHVEHSLAYAVTNTQRDNLVADVRSFSASGELARWEYGGSVSSLPYFDLVFGADLEAAKNNGDSRDNAGVYLEYLSDFSEQLHITAGLRHDDNEDFGGNSSHRLSLAWVTELAGGSFKIRSSQGTGFRAPSPFEIAYNAGPLASPPAALLQLHQEKSRGREIGVEFSRTNALQLEAVYFDQEIEDAITFDQSGFSGYLQDSGRSSSRGVELAALLTIGERWRLTTNYTWNDTQRPDGTPRLRRPRHLYNLGVSWRGIGNKLTLHTFARMSRDAVDEMAGALVPLDDFTVVDIGGSYQATDMLEFHARIENALDERYEEITTYRTAERSAHVGFRLHLQLL